MLLFLKRNVQLFVVAALTAAVTLHHNLTVPVAPRFGTLAPRRREVVIIDFNLKPAINNRTKLLTTAALLANIDGFVIGSTLSIFEAYRRRN